MIRQKVTDLIITLLLWSFVITVAVHEMGHNLVSTWLGYDSYVKFSFGSGLTYNAGSHWLVYLSGGWIASLVSGLLWWRAKTSPTLWDMDDEAVLGIIASMQFGVGIGEVVGLYYGRIVLAELLLGSLFVIYPIIYYIPQIGEWLLEKEPL